MKGTQIKIWCGLLFLVISSTAMAQTDKYFMIVGTYTSPGKSEGLHVFDYNSGTADTKLLTVARVSSPSYFVLSGDKQHLYAVSESDAKEVNAFSFDRSSGKLSFLNAQPSVGDGPTYISIDDRGKYVFTANYGGGSLTALPVEADRKLGADLQNIQHYGKSVAKDKPHVHSTVLSPDNKFLLVADLGTDKLHVYKYDPAKRPNPLSPAEVPFVSLPPGAGPRHSIFHPDGNYVYVVAELSSEVYAYSFKDGKLSHFQTLALLPAGYSGRGDAADIQVSPDGRFLYANTRGVINEITIFSIDKKTGMLREIGKHSSMGEKPRTFTIDPSGNWLLVANKNSNSINILRRDPESGLLSPSGKIITVDQPSLIRFVKTLN